MANGTAGTKGTTYSQWSKADAVKEYKSYDYDVTSDQWKSETQYTNGQKFKEIQDALYSDQITDDVAQNIKALDNSMRPLSDNVELSRTLMFTNWGNSVGVDVDDMLPITQGGSTDYSTLDSVIGKTFKPKGYTSTSYDLNKNAAPDAPVVLKLRAKKGTKAVVTSNHAESEVILHRNGSYKITDYEVIEKTPYKKQVIFYADFK